MFASHIVSLKSTATPIYSSSTVCSKQANIFLHCKLFLLNEIHAVAFHRLISPKLQKVVPAFASLLLKRFFLDPFCQTQSVCTTCKSSSGFQWDVTTVSPKQSYKQPISFFPSNTVAFPMKHFDQSAVQTIVYDFGVG